MKAVLIITKNLTIGILGAVVVAVITDAIDLVLVDYLSAFAWSIYIGCKAGLELINLED